MPVRRQLRAWATITLVLQTAWVFALVPRDCCAAHTPKTSTSDCHEEVTATHCPMADSTGAACPMHSDHGSRPGEDCGMRGNCSGPMAALLSLLSAQGILPTTRHVTPSVTVSDYRPDGREHLIRRVTPPDSPPPRA
jgi:hypothetical protein